MLAFGAMIGTATVLVHATWWGLPLGVLAALITSRALAGGASRLGFSLGWAAVVGYWSVPQPAGDYLVAGDLSGYTLLITAAILIVSALATVPSQAVPAVPNEGSERDFPTMTP